MLLEICMQINSVPWYLYYLDKLASKKYAKTINLLCKGDRVFVKYQSQGGVTPKHFVRPCHCQPGVD